MGFPLPHYQILTMTPLPKQHSNSNRYLTVGCWNIQGLRTNDGHKKVIDHFLNEINKLDIIGLVETHTIEGENNYESLQGFKLNTSIN